MNEFVAGVLRLVLRVVVVAMGVVLFLSLVAAVMVLALVWALRAGWARLTGKPVTERKPPPGVSFVDGDWLYDEFKGDKGVKTLDIESSPINSIFDTIRKAFGG